MLDDHLAILPDSVDSGGPTLDSIVFTPTEDVLNTLKLGKASGLDNVNNRILKKPRYLCQIPYVIFLTIRCLNVCVQIYGKRQMFHLSIKKIIHLSLVITDRHLS